MSTSIELDDKRRKALGRAARRRQLSVQHLIEQVIDEFLDRAEEDEELLKESARMAKRTGLHERDAVQIVREWRQRQTASMDDVPEFHPDIEYRIRQCMRFVPCTRKEAIEHFLDHGSKQALRERYQGLKEKEAADTEKKAG